MLHVKNYMEEAVCSLIDEVLKKIDMCKCEKCRMDIIALALNDLPPKYVVTEKGMLYSKANAFVQQFEVDIMAAITKASIVVKENPRHL
jgi:competence protein ComFB